MSDKNISNGLHNELRDIDINTCSYINTHLYSKVRLDIKERLDRITPYIRALSLDHGYETLTRLCNVIKSSYLSTEVIMKHINSNPTNDKYIVNLLQPLKYIIETEDELWALDSDDVSHNMEFYRLFALHAEIDNVFSHIMKLPTKYTHEEFVDILGKLYSIIKDNPNMINITDMDISRHEIIDDKNNVVSCEIRYTFR